MLVSFQVHIKDLGYSRVKTYQEKILLTDPHLRDHRLPNDLLVIDIRKLLEIEKAPLLIEK